MQQFVLVSQCFLLICKGSESRAHNQIYLSYAEAHPAFWKGS